MLAGGQRFDITPGHAIGPEAGVIDRFAGRRGVCMKYERGGKAGGGKALEGAAARDAGGGHAEFLLNVLANGRRKPAGCCFYQPAYAGRSPLTCVLFLLQSLDLYVAE